MNKHECCDLPRRNCRLCESIDNKTLEGGIMMKGKKKSAPPAKAPAPPMKPPMEPKGGKKC